MQKLKMVIPKGRIYNKVVNLLNDSGYRIEVDGRIYIPRIDDNEIEAKIMKPQNIPKLVELGAHDVGFTGYDWIIETGVNVEEILDLKFDPIKIVAAIPDELLKADLRKKKIIVASEYENIATKFLNENDYDYLLLRTFGTTEVFPPEDANMIIDNTSTGRTLKEHNLRIIKILMKSSTRFIANKEALKDSWKVEKIDEMKMLFQSVLDARERVILEMNVSKDKLENLVRFLPSMRSPTVAPLYGESGFAVKIAVKRNEVSKLLPLLKKNGATDILEYEFTKVVL